MSSIGNKQVVVAAYASMAAGNPAPYLDLLSDDVSITMFGSHRFAKTFRGKAEIYQHLFGPIRATLDGSIRISVTHAVADDDWVVVEAQGQARTKNGRDYNNAYCFVFKMKDG